MRDVRRFHVHDARRRGAGSCDDRACESGATVSGTIASRRTRPTTSASPACSSRSTARVSAPKTLVAVFGVVEYDHDADGNHTLTAIARDAAGNVRDLDGDQR
jgi:hypothetical protein